MDEKIIIEGKFKVNQLIKTLLIFGIALIIFALIFCKVTHSTGDYYTQIGGIGVRAYTDPEYGISYFELLQRALTFDPNVHIGAVFHIGFYAGFVSILLSIFFKFMMSKCAITVTDKRVIGKANFGYRVDLPLNQISAVAQGLFSRLFSSIIIATSSGRIHFWFLKNRDEIFDELSNLIKTFQIQKSDFSNVETPASQQTSNADELKKFKELLDSGVITQEEFDAKKKQLLGL